MRKIFVLTGLIVATNQSMAQAPNEPPGSQAKIENVCARTDVQKALMQTYNADPSLTKAHGRIKSLSNAATRMLDIDGGLVSCHADYQFDNGDSEPMTFSFPLPHLRYSPRPASATPARKTLAFDPKETCGRIMRGLDYQGAFDALSIAEAEIQSDITSTYSALTETYSRLGDKNLTAEQIAINQKIRDSQLKHIDFQQHFVQQMYLQCPPYINEHHFDGR